MDYSELKQQLVAPKNKKDLYSTIVNAPFKYNVEAAYLFLGIIVLLLVNEKDGTIDRIALSDTELAKNTEKVTTVPFSKIKIPLKQRGNIIASSIDTMTPKDTIDWRFLFDPVLSPEAARINQASAGVAYSAVYPLDKRRGALIYSYYNYIGEIGKAQHDFMREYTSLVNKALKSSQT